MDYTVKKDFKWAHRGVEVKEYLAGKPLDSDDPELIEVAKKEGWIEKPKGRSGSQTSAQGAGGTQAEQPGGEGEGVGGHAQSSTSPDENKAHGGAPETKSS